MTNPHSEHKKLLVAAAIWVVLAIGATTPAYSLLTAQMDGGDTGYEDEYYDETYDETYDSTYDETYEDSTYEDEYYEDTYEDEYYDETYEDPYYDETYEDEYYDEYYEDPAYYDETYEDSTYEDEYYDEEYYDEEYDDGDEEDEDEDEYDSYEEDYYYDDPAYEEYMNGETDSYEDTYDYENYEDEYYYDYEYEDSTSSYGYEDPYYDETYEDEYYDGTYYEAAPDEEYYDEYDEYEYEDSASSDGYVDPYYDETYYDEEYFEEYYPEDDYYLDYWYEDEYEDDSSYYDEYEEWEDTFEDVIYEYLDEIEDEETREAIEAELATLDEQSSSDGVVDFEMRKQELLDAVASHLDEEDAFFFADEIADEIEEELYWEELVASAEEEEFDGCYTEFGLWTSNYDGCAEDQYRYYEEEEEYKAAAPEVIIPADVEAPIETLTPEEEAELLRQLEEHYKAENKRQQKELVESLDTASTKIATIQNTVQDDLSDDAQAYLEESLAWVTEQQALLTSQETTTAEKALLVEEMRDVLGEVQEVILEDQGIDPTAPPEIRKIAKEIEALLRNYAQVFIILEDEFVPYDPLVRDHFQQAIDLFYEVRATCTEEDTSTCSGYYDVLDLIADLEEPLQEILDTTHSSVQEQVDEVFAN